MSINPPLKLKPDSWHALTANGKLITSCLYKQDVITSKASFYLLIQDKSSYFGRFYMEQEIHTILDKDFNEARLEHKGIKCNNIMHSYSDYSFTAFSIVDTLGAERVIQFTGGIKAYEEVFQSMEDLSSYSGGWKDLEQTLEIKALKQKIKDLEQENSSLKRDSDNLAEAKTTYRKLSQLLTF